jgi:hypothetical protein
MPKCLFEASYSPQGVEGISSKGGSSRRDAVADMAEGLGASKNVPWAQSQQGVSEYPVLQSGCGRCANEELIGVFRGRIRASRMNPGHVAYVGPQ